MSQMMRIHARKLLRSRTFIFTFLFSLLLLLIPTLLRIYALYGAKDITLSPAWYYFGYLEPMPVSPIKMVLEPYIMVAIPFIGSISYSSFYYDDLHDNALTSFLTRVSKKSYLLSGLVVIFFSAFFIVFISIVVSHLCFCIALPIDSLKFTNINISKGDFKVENINFLRILYIKHPYIYFMIYSIISSFFSALIAVLSFGLSLFIRKSRLLILLLPGLLTIIFSFVLSYIGISKLTPYRLILPWTGPDNISGISILIMFLGLLVLDALVVWIGFARNKDVL